MRFRGGGIGHKSTREATDWFLQDRDILDLMDDKQPDMETHSDFDDKDDGEEGNLSVDGDEDQEDWMDEDDEEEGDYSYLQRSRGKRLTVPILNHPIRTRMMNWVLKMVRV